MKRFVLLMMILAIQRTILLPYNIAAKTLNNQIIEAAKVFAHDHTLGRKSSVAHFLAEAIMCKLAKIFPFKHCGYL